MTRKNTPERKHQIQTLERLDAIHKELKTTNEYLDDLIEARKTEKTELSFLLSLVGVGMSVSSLLLKTLSGDSRLLLIGGGISMFLLVIVSSYMRKISKSRPIPKEIILLLLILFATSLYSILLGFEVL